VNLIEFEGGTELQLSFADGPRRHANNRRVVFHFIKHDGVCRYFRIVPDSERTEYFGSRADQHVVSDGWVPFADVLAGSAQGDALIDGAPVADFSSFPNHHAHAVVDEKAFANGGSRMNFDARPVPRMLRNSPGKKRAPMQVKPVGDPIQAYGLEAGILEYHLPGSQGGRISFRN
jgi:hypothetical protein